MKFPVQFTDEEIEEMRSTIMPKAYTRDEAILVKAYTKNPFVEEYMLIKLNNFTLIMADYEKIDLQENRQRELIISGYAFEQLKKPRGLKGLLRKIKHLLSE